MAEGSAVRQRLFGIEIIPQDTGAVGTLILPFGLDLAKGAKLTVGKVTGAPLAFRTCIPAGCIVPLQFDAGMLAALRTNTTLSVTVQAVGKGVPHQVPVSLGGFGPALDRAQQLAS